MAISIFDLFKIGIGPSSSHTVGPMKAAQQFVTQLQSDGRLQDVVRVKSEMYGSLGATGIGHGTPKAVLLGLEGELPETVVVASIADRVSAIREQQTLKLAGVHSVIYHDHTDLILNRREELPFHSNGMKFTAYGSCGKVIEERSFYSVGGGFVVDEDEAGNDVLVEDSTELALPFSSGNELLDICEREKLRISDVMWANEAAWRSREDTQSYLRSIWQTMQECIANGISAEGILPGGLKVNRRARQLYQQLLQRPEASLQDPLTILDWVTLYALAVNEENAAGGRIVTAPTNGAAGIVPAVLNYYSRFVPGANEEGIERFLLTAAAVGILYKKNASISGAEVGCQGEVGSACSMAAAGLAEVLGATPQQVENAAEIAMEHNLGLTCDPIGGLVQVPCIERNAMAAVKAIHAARMAIRGDGSHFVSLDKVIRTMRDTGRDMQAKYKETARGGLAINVVEVPVNIVEC
ncbi:L-serine ammonia-lyase [Pseudoteredinibacter isoporae]|uniref:L-serine dehydratase n=1 Tax=Pseudoteredinibacter isoporae TaxID=570281 RepID=A0A7X0JU24_9GAMM|nr:L-serine ammonia-lyase [Pseudoteredinibacter isoporae]MBB6521708.1 L-serine dehydratase [Pseudoteredinibacter isoporae]NHO87256.1 L-serine ammonia-lyase [Pseudoteredinibacter isoporae]NIB23112.1 L-serine ammonia-lyase [Pseudoteredinibacter isoporae]